MSIESQNGVSHRRSRAAVGLAACAVAALSSGVVFAGSASATPTALADKFASTVTDDGWSLDLAATKLSANPAGTDNCSVTPEFDRRNHLRSPCVSTSRA